MEQISGTCRGYFLFFRGPDWEIKIDDKKCCINELLVELYEKVGTEMRL
jgi:hypothetical protein